LDLHCRESFHSLIIPLGAIYRHGFGIRGLAIVSRCIYILLYCYSMMNAVHSLSTRADNDWYSSGILVLYTLSLQGMCYFFGQESNAVPILRLVDPRPLRLFVRIDTRTSKEHRSLLQCSLQVWSSHLSFLFAIQGILPSPRNRLAKALLTSTQGVLHETEKEPKRGQKYFKRFLDLLRVTSKLDFGSI
jgi:hypothetical protein